MRLREDPAVQGDEEQEIQLQDLQLVHVPRRLGDDQGLLLS